MSREPAKWRRTTAEASPGVPAMYSLPPELLEIIFGFLDVRALSTARLVCGQFRGAASMCIHSVGLSVENLRSRPDTTLNNFPNLSRVSVFDVKQDDLLMLAQSPVVDAVTHLRAVKHVGQLPQRGRVTACLPLPPLPNLMSLTVSHAPSHAFPFPQTLRELILESPIKTLRTANLVASLTNLTCLQIDVRGMRKPFEAVAALTALQRLDITCSMTVTPFVAELTLLTHLNFEVSQCPSEWTLVSLTRLHRLVHLGVGPLSANMELQLQASIGTFSSLRSLHLRLIRLPGGSAFSTVCMAPFSQLTALRLEGYRLDASFLPRFNLDGLQDLSLTYGVELHQDGVTALRRATGLTHLELREVYSRIAPEGLVTALSHMSRLRALVLQTTAAILSSSCSKAIGLLTEMTRLDWPGRGVETNADAEECLGLKKLRVLRMPVCCRSSSDPVTPETVFAIAKLPELRKFYLFGSFFIWGGHFKLTDDVRARLNAERHDKGWPPLEFNIFI